MTDLDELHFFTTPPHQCSYLQDQSAVTLFLDPQFQADTELYSQLSQVGFRRSGRYIYKPHCKTCRACVPVRIPLAAFKMRRTQRKIWKRNQDISIRWEAPYLSDDSWLLYARYINSRHRDGDMYPPDQSQFKNFLIEGRPEAQFIEFRLKDQLIAIMVADQLSDSLSAIYTFFDPDKLNRSLGVFAILTLIESARQRNLEHVYLGYWIQNCQKMDYKADYRPIEGLIENRWQVLRQ